MENEIYQEISLMYNKAPGYRARDPIALDLEFHVLIHKFLQNFDSHFSREIGKNNLNFPPVFKFYFTLATLRNNTTSQDVQEMLTKMMNRLQFAIAHCIRYERVKKGDLKRLKQIHKF